MEFKVPDMSCGHCTSSIEKAIKEADPAAWVECDLETRQVEIDSALSAAELNKIITCAGFSPEEIGA